MDKEENYNRWNAQVKALLENEERRSWKNYLAQIQFYGGEIEAAYSTLASVPEANKLIAFETTNHNNLVYCYQVMESLYNGFMLTEMQMHELENIVVQNGPNSSALAYGLLKEHAGYDHFELIRYPPIDERNNLISSKPVDEASFLVLFPHPASIMLTLNFESLPLTLDSRFDVVDALGQVVLSGSINNLARQQLLDVSKLNT